MSSTSARGARCSTCRPPTRGRWRRPGRSRCDALILDLEDAVAPDAKPAARDAACARPRVGRVRHPRGHHPRQRCRHRVARRRPGGRVRGRARPRSSCRRSTAPTRSASSRRWRPTARRATPVWAMVETPGRDAARARRSPRARERLTVLVMGTNDLANELHAEHVPGRAPLLTGLALALLAAGRREGDPRRRLQRRQGRRRVPGRVPAGSRDGLRRQDPDPPRPGRACQRGVRPERAGRRRRARHRRRVGRDGRGPGVVTYRGRMIENLHVETARRTLALHEAVMPSSPDSDWPQPPHRAGQSSDLSRPAQG